MSTREDFEAWYSDGGLAPRSIEKSSYGHYLLSNTYLAWMTWRAATARQEAKVKVLVEALERISKRCPTDHEHYTCASVGDQARAALTAAKTEFSYAPRGITE